jgi:VIT1/CCC1 family predicted Fe2+/Mn2+ transporter
MHTGRETSTMEPAGDPAEAVREPLLNPVDRVSELLFGLLMALSFVGAISVAESGREEVETLFAAALGCNLAWGLVDAVMYLVRTVTDRGRALTLVRSVREAPEAAEGRALVERSLPRGTAGLFASTELEAIRGRIVALPSVPARPRLTWNDVLAALVIFLLVVLATFPVVLPFALMQDVGMAKNVSRAIALAMLFFGGLALGRYAGYGSWKVGFIMVGLGVGLVVAINALGG